MSRISDDIVTFEVLPGHTIYTGGGTFGYRAGETVRMPRNHVPASHAHLVESRPAKPTKQPAPDKPKDQPQD
jgi:hypothetical protein